MCKSWRSLISDPNFAKSQLKRAISNPTYNATRIFTSDSLYLPFYALDYESPSSFANVDNDEAIVALDYPLEETENGSFFMGSCDGLICMLHDSESIILWNPCIKVYKELPKPPISFLNATILFGLGYDSSTDAYKVVIAAPRSTSSNETIVQIFNAATGSWGMITGFENFVPKVDDGAGRFSNGALHWLASHSDGSSYRELIISLDLVDEKFREIASPDDGGRNLLLENLNILDGCLSLIGYGGEGDNIENLEIWVMKEYGRASSWTRIIVLCIANFKICEYIQPVCFTKDGELVIDLGGGCLIRYNIKENTSRELKNRIEDKFFCTMYVESLVFPHGDW